VREKEVSMMAKFTFADSYRELQEMCEKLNPGEPTVFLGGLIVNEKPEE
jgi:hypothetical protein